MSTAGAADESDAAEESTLEQRISAALTLTTATPSALAEELLVDRRVASSWWIRLFALGYAILVALVFGLRSEHDPQGGAIPLIVPVVALLVALAGGLGRWRVEWSRLRRRTPDAVFTHRERLVLLAGIDRGKQANRTPLPLLRELARWRLQSLWADLALSGGAAVAFYLPNLFRDEGPPATWHIVSWAVLSVLAIAVVVVTVRQRVRCRRFLADAAGWAPPEPG